MKICWDNLEGLRYNKDTEKWYKKNATFYYKDSCKECKEPFLATYKYQKFCQLSCSQKGENHPLFGKKHSNETKEKMSKEKKKSYKYIERELYKRFKKIFVESNGLSFKFLKNKAVHYNTYESRLSYCEEIKEYHGILKVKCTYCGKWYIPTKFQVRNRISALNGQEKSLGTENRFYCSNKCKIACPIYGRRKYQNGHPKLNENNQTREAQPELRQMVFKRDNYTCLKCRKHQDNLDVSLHCHHIEGILWNPLESADIDQCMTVCKDCHKEIHKQEDCGYHDLQCKEKK